MKKIILVFMFLTFHLCSSQNVYVKISDYNKKVDGKNYATFKFVNSSYSSGRPFVTMVVNKNLIVEYENKISKAYHHKQEYTDVYLIGIENFNYSNISDIDKKIIAISLDDIIEFRKYFGLPIEEDTKHISSSIIYIKNEMDFCKVFGCEN
ncbi:hypothetical protein FFWV33_04705 [Flavobacterium faecale]|uniref:Uncharacterized protein n=1 Tax=Flavobacterium faecale TaxID=1355330 RepID=A0A2S1LAV4_9FLAO|nr:hypothetical protein [Flavobacterium faecale]AWG20890.1 hypothetical protein FFWV33_04705 [Flavobacterium faecale]